MRLLKETFERDGSGSVTLMPEDPEDMWAAYNLIREKDHLRASAIRRVTTESSTGTTSSQRVHTALTIRVKSTNFDVQGGQLHVSGQIIQDTAVAHAGQHHTLDLELNRPFTIDKTEGWDSVSIAIVREACNPGKGASAWAVVMQAGKAYIYVLLGERTVLRTTVSDSPVSKKDRNNTTSTKKSGNFFQTTLDTLLRHIDLDQSLPILLASAGYTASSFKQFFLDHATRSGNKKLLSQKANLVVVHVPMGQSHAIQDIINSPSVKAILSNTRYAREAKLMDDFEEMLRKESDKIRYGAKQVEDAVEQGAVGRGGGTLLISNELFRAQDVAVRQRWVNLVDKVRDVEGGDVRVLSSEHESGKRLKSVGGIAAILTFPLPELESDDEN